MVLEKEKINGVKVHKLDLPTIDIKKIRGYDMFPEIYSNIFICARKKQGKTTLLYNILRKCIDKNTKVYFFVSTIKTDPSYKKILEQLDAKKIPYEYFISFKEGKGKDILKDIVDELKQGAEEEEDPNEEPQPTLKELMWGEGHVNLRIKRRKPAKVSPRVCFVFDDISAEIRNNPNVAELVKQNRHFKSKVIISSQFVTDIPPATRAMMDYWLLFGGHDDTKLEMIYESSDPTINYVEFMDVYKDATSVKHNFLYIDKCCGSYRKNFDEQYILCD